MLTFNQIEQIFQKGYDLNVLYILEFIKEQGDTLSFCSIPKLEGVYNMVLRKGLVTGEGKITILGQELLDFISSGVEVMEKPKKVKDESFEKWWKLFPPTDSFTYKGKKFEGTRGLRTGKETCKQRLKKILEEGEYTIDQLIAALEYEILQKKENSLKSGTNKLTFLQNSATYLFQKSYEPFMELIKEGSVIKESTDIVNSTDI